VQNTSHSNFLSLDENAYIEKYRSFPTYYFNNKKTFLSPLSSLLHASSFLNLKKTALSLSSLIQLSSFLNHKEDADKREKEDGERERRVYGRKKKNR
jgi:hypothetical protein